MRNIKLFDSGEHKFILLNESEPGEEDGIRSNQYLIVHRDNGVLLDPGGFGVMPSVLTELLRYIKTEQIQAIILSHQDPDIVGGLSTWLELTDAPVYVSNIWMRFLPHYGIASMAQFVGVPDAGKECTIAPGFQLQLIPAHFLHSEGQINVYDPRSKILFTGDIGAAMLPVDRDYEFVDDFAAHLPFIEGFHRRYMVCNKAARFWVEAVSALDIDVLAPQHGPIYRGRAVADFLAWFKELRCGVDLMTRSGHFEMGKAWNEQ
jgi:flavorubredoxin